MVDVEQRALRAFEEHRRSSGNGAVNSEADVFSERQQTTRESVQHVERVIHIRALGSRGRELNVRVRNPALHELSQTFGISQVKHSYSAPPKLVLIRRADSPPGRTNLLACRALAINQLVVREHEVGAVAHVKPSLYI